jgi:hypothetical protein
MVNYKTARRAAAFAKVKIFEGVPSKYADRPKVVVPTALKAVAAAMKDRSHHQAQSQQLSSGNMGRSLRTWSKPELRNQRTNTPRGWYRSHRSLGWCRTQTNNSGRQPLSSWRLTKSKAG